MYVEITESILSLKTVVKNFQLVVLMQSCIVAIAKNDEFFWIQKGAAISLSKEMSTIATKLFNTSLLEM